MDQLNMWMLINTKGKRLRNLKGELTPVFKYPNQAYKYAQSLGINPEYYSIAKTTK